MQTLPSKTMKQDRGHSGTAAYKQRLDQAVAARGLTATRSQAESWIRLGKVFVNGRAQTKPGFLVAESDKLELKAAAQYVSRAALKLASVAQKLSLDFRGKVVLDVGSSTGGFTDYALQHGAKKVIAVEAGSNQLHPSLRGNDKIELHEQTDIRDVVYASRAGGGHWGTPSARNAVSTMGEGLPTLKARLRASPPASAKQGKLNSPPASFGTRRSTQAGTPTIAISDVPDIIVIDVSFISLREVLPHVAKLASPKTKIIAMVKPQFEAAASNLKHKGVIKNDRMRREILKSFEDWARATFVIVNKADSEIAGAKGNLERFYLLSRSR